VTLTPRSLALLALLPACTVSVGAAEPRPPLTKAIEVRSLTAAEAQLGLDVRIRGVVTFSGEPDAVFIQDATAGTFFRPEGGRQFNVGDQVEVIGHTQPGLYLPGIYLSTTHPDPARVLGRQPLPDAIPIRYQDLISGRYHYQRVAIEGVVRSLVTQVEPSVPTAMSNSAHRYPRTIMQVMVDERVLEVRVATTQDVQPPPPAINSRIRVVGLAAGSINSRRQLIQPYLRTQDWSEITVLQPAVPEAEVPRISAADLLTFHVSTPRDRLIRLGGVVTACLSGGLAYVRDEGSAFAVRFLEATEVKPGEKIEVLGFPEMDRFSALLADARLISREPGEAPAPVEIRTDDPISGAHAGDLIAVTARVTDSFRTESGPALTLQIGGRALQLRGPMPVPAPQVGSVVRVTGICQVESSVGAGYSASPDAVVIRTRSAADLAVIALPSGWTVRRLALILAALATIVVFGALWITMLRRRVAEQTAILRESIGSAAALEERQRIAREFHDSLEQDLAGLNLRLDAVATRSLDEKARLLLVASRSLVGRIQTETRNLISDLRNPAETAGDLVEQHREAPGPAVSLQVTTVPPRLPARSVHHLRMIAAEGVANALKHAGATHIALELDQFDRRVMLRVTDDGRGFDPGRDTHGRIGHFGCVGIRERARALGAEAVWHSAPGQGTRLEITLPLAESTSPQPLTITP